jgi:hypothetical protein
MYTTQQTMMTRPCCSGLLNVADLLVVVELRLPFERGVVGCGVIGQQDIHAEGGLREADGTHDLKGHRGDQRQARDGAGSEGGHHRRGSFVLLPAGTHPTGAVSAALRACTPPPSAQGILTRLSKSRRSAARALDQSQV